MVTSSPEATELGATIFISRLLEEIIFNPPKKMKMAVAKAKKKKMKEPIKNLLKKEFLLVLTISLSRLSKEEFVPQSVGTSTFLSETGVRLSFGTIFSFLEYRVLLKRSILLSSDSI